MDLITLNKLFSNFDCTTSCVFDGSLLYAEIEQLESLKIISELEDGRFVLSRENLYKYAKSLSKEGNYDGAIIIFKYLLEFNNSISESWRYSINYQLFKNFFYLNNYHQAYEYFKFGFDRRNPIYPIMLNMLNYLLRQKPEQKPTDPELSGYFSEKQYKIIKEYVRKNNIRLTDSQKQIFESLSDKVIAIEEKIDNDVHLLIKKKNYKDLSAYILKLYKTNRANHTLRLFGFMSDTMSNILNDSYITPDSEKKFFNLLNLYQSKGIDKVIKEYGLDPNYKAHLAGLVINCFNNLNNNKYLYYFEKYANRKINDIVSEKKIGVIENLATYDNALLLRMAEDNPDLNINNVYNNDKKLIVISKEPTDEVDFDLDYLNELYEQRQFRKCINGCIKYINKNGDRNGFVSCLLKECYLAAGNKEEAKKTDLLINHLSNNIDVDIIDLEAKFYGINNIAQIRDFVARYNISVDFASVSFGLNESQMAIVRLLFARYYFSVGDEEKGSEYFNSVLDEDDIVVNYLRKEIDDENSYKVLDYNKTKEFIKKLELKK